jgi:hypothetical protein
MGTRLRRNWPIIAWVLSFVLIAAGIFQVQSLAENVEGQTVQNQQTLQQQREFFTRIAIEACKANNVQDHITIELANAVKKITPEAGKVVARLRESIYPCARFTREFLQGVFRRTDE